MGEKLLESEMEAILSKEPHIVSIHPAEDWEIPSIDSSILPDTEYDPSEPLIDYLKMHYIVDDFGADHKARREWRTELSSKYDWFNDYYANNAIKLGNRIPTLVNALSFLEKGYNGSNRDQLHKKCDKIRNTIGNISQHSISTDYAKEVKQAIYDTLIFLSQQSPVS